MFIINILKALKLLPLALYEAWSLDYNIKDQKLHELARQSYQLCTSWFGLPVDATKGYRLAYGLHNKCLPGPTFHSYLISIKRGYGEEQYASVIGHEIYHRVTLLRPGLRREVWVDEMIAACTEHQVVFALGYEGYATVMHKRIMESKELLSIQAIKNIPMKAVYTGAGRPPYELDFSESVVALGRRLEAQVGWDNIRKIVHCQTWEEWLLQLTPECQTQAKEILDL